MAYDEKFRRRVNIKIPGILLPGRKRRLALGRGVITPGKRNWKKQGSLRIIIAKTAKGKQIPKS
jgi:hypothetical protein